MAALVALFGSGGWGADSPTRVEAPGAADAVRAMLEVEKTLLQEDRQRLARFRVERSDLAARSAEARTAVDAAIEAPDPPSAARVDALITDLDELDRKRLDLEASERGVLEQIRDRLRRIELLEERVASLAARAGGARGPAAGTWDVVLMPSGQKGTFVLVQTGTLVTGTYDLDGGWTGSLQGTLIQRKLYLDRIDARVGRWGRFEGFVSPDGTRIRGNWTKLDVGSEGGSEGVWSGSRQTQGP